MASSHDNLLDPPQSISHSQSSISSGSVPVAGTGAGDVVAATAAGATGVGASAAGERNPPSSGVLSALPRDHHGLHLVAPKVAPGAVPPSLSIFSPTTTGFEDELAETASEAAKSRLALGGGQELRGARSVSMGRIPGPGEPSSSLSAGKLKATGKTVEDPTGRPGRAATSLGLFHSPPASDTVDVDADADDEDEAQARAREEAIRRRKAAEKLEGFFGTTYDELLKPSLSSSAPGSTSPPQLCREPSQVSAWGSISSPINNLFRTASSFVFQSSSNLASGSAVSLSQSSIFTGDGTPPDAVPLNSNDLDAETRRVLSRRTRKVASILGVTPPAELIVQPTDSAEIRHRKSITGLAFLLDRVGNNDDDVAIVIRQAANMGAIPSDTLEHAIGDAVASSSSQGSSSGGPSAAAIASVAASSSSPERSIRQKRIRKLQSFFGYQALRAILADIETQINREVQTPDARGSLIADLRKLQDKIDNRFVESSGDESGKEGRDRTYSISTRIRGRTDSNGSKTAEAAAAVAGVAS